MILGAQKGVDMTRGSEFGSRAEVFSVQNSGALREQVLRKRLIQDYLRARQLHVMPARTPQVHSRMEMKQGNLC